MTSVAKTNETRQAGFTLIEIVLVLSIAAIVAASAVGLMVYSQDGNTIRKKAAQIELLAKQARTTAILKQIPYALEFREDVVRLLPFAQAEVPNKKSSAKRQSKTAPVADDQSSDDNEVKLQDGMAVLIRHWNSEKWLNTVKNTVQVWRFDPDGLCEPLSVKLTLGQSWSEDTYHPLTATIEETQSSSQ
jgi:type II secretion system protein H